MFYQIFFPPQVKRFAIITYKHVIHHLLHELPKNVRLRILGTFSPRSTQRPKTKDPRKLGNTKKVPKPPRMIAQRPVRPRQNKNSANATKKLLKNRN